PQCASGLSHLDALLTKRNWWANGHCCRPPPGLARSANWIRLGVGAKTMPKPLLEILVPMLSFSGAAILCVDALRIKRNIKVKAGAEKLVQYLQSVGESNLITDERGKPLDSQRALDEWLADRTLRLGWVG